MADFGDMNLKITADVGDVLGKVDSLKAKLNQLVESQQQLKVKIADVNTSLRTVEKEITQTSVKMQGLNTTTKEGKTAYAALDKELLQLGVHQRNLNKELATAKTELVNTTGQIKNHSTALKEANTASGGFTSGISKLYSGLRTIANIIPGLGIGSLIALLAGPLVDAFSSLGGVIDPFVKAQKDLNVALAEAEGSVAGEVAQLNSLVSIAKDTSLSYSARTQAVKELNKEYPELHGNINLENINTAAVTATINREIEAIKRRSQAKALEKLIDDESVKVEKAKAEGIKGQINAFENFLDKTAELAGAPGLFSNVSGQLAAYNKIVTEGTAKIDVFSKKLNELNREAAIAGTLFVEPKVKTDKAIRDVETIADVLAKLRRQEGVIEFDINIKDADKAKEKIQAIESAIKHLVDKFKLTSQSPVIINLQAEIQDINLREQFNKVLKGITGEKVIVPFEFQFENQQTAERIAKAIKESLNRFAPALQNEKFQVGIGLDINVNAILADLEDAEKILFLKSQGITKGLQDGLQVAVEGLRFPELTKLTTDTLKRLIEFQTAVQSALTNTGTDLFSGFGEAIGNAIGGKDDVVKGLFDGIFSSVGGQLEALGKFLIKSGVEMLIAKKAIKALFSNPFALIAAGIGLVALGALIKSQINKSFSGFAEGGYVKGPGSKTSDSIPARLSNNEYVIKARSVDKFGIKFFDQLNAGKLPDVFTQNTGKVVFQSYAPKIEVIVKPNDEKLISHISDTNNLTQSAIKREINNSKVELLKSVSNFSLLKERNNFFKDSTATEKTLVNKETHTNTQTFVNTQKFVSNLSDLKIYEKSITKVTEGGYLKEKSFHSFIERFSLVNKFDKGRDNNKEKISTEKVLGARDITKEKSKEFTANNIFKNGFTSIKDYLKDSKSLVLKVYKGTDKAIYKFTSADKKLPYVIDQSKSFTGLNTLINRKEKITQSKESDNLFSSIKEKSKDFLNTQKFANSLTNLSKFYEKITGFKSENFKSKKAIEFLNQGRKQNYDGAHLSGEISKQPSSFNKDFIRSVQHQIEYFNKRNVFAETKNTLQKIAERSFELVTNLAKNKVLSSGSKENERSAIFEKFKSDEKLTSNLFARKTTEHNDSAQLSTGLKSTRNLYKHFNNFKNTDFKAFLASNKTSDTNTRSFSLIAKNLTENNSHDNISKVHKLLTETNVSGKAHVKELQKEVLSSRILISILNEAKKSNKDLVSKSDSSISQNFITRYFKTFLDSSIKDKATVSSFKVLSKDNLVRTTNDINASSNTKNNLKEVFSSNFSNQALKNISFRYKEAEKSLFISSLKDSDNSKVNERGLFKYSFADSKNLKLTDISKSKDLSKSDSRNSQSFISRFKELFNVSDKTSSSKVLTNKIQATNDKNSVSKNNLKEIVSTFSNNALKNLSFKDKEVKSFLISSLKNSENNKESVVFKLADFKNRDISKTKETLYLKTSDFFKSLINKTFLNDYFSDNKKSTDTFKFSADKTSSNLSNKYFISKDKTSLTSDKNKISLNDSKAFTDSQKSNSNNAINTNIEKLLTSKNVSGKYIFKEAYKDLLNNSIFKSIFKEVTSKSENNYSLKEKINKFSNVSDKYFSHAFKNISFKYKDSLNVSNDKTVFTSFKAFLDKKVSDKASVSSFNNINNASSYKDIKKISNSVYSDYFKNAVKDSKFSKIYTLSFSNALKSHEDKIRNSQFVSEKEKRLTKFSDNKLTDRANIYKTNNSVYNDYFKDVGSKFSNVSFKEKTFSSALKFFKDNFKDSRFVSSFIGNKVLDSSRDIKTISLKNTDFTNKIFKVSDKEGRLTKNHFSESSKLITDSSRTNTIRFENIKSITGLNKIATVISGSKIANKMSLPFRYWQPAVLQTFKEGKKFNYVVRTSDLFRSFRISDKNTKISLSDSKIFSDRQKSNETYSRLSSLLITPKSGELNTRLSKFFSSEKQTNSFNNNLSSVFRYLTDKLKENVFTKNNFSDKLISDRINSDKTHTVSFLKSALRIIENVKFHSDNKTKILTDRNKYFASNTNRENVFTKNQFTQNSRLSDNKLEKIFLSEKIGNVSVLNSALNVVEKLHIYNSDKLNKNSFSEKILKSDYVSNKSGFGGVKSGFSGFGGMSLKNAKVFNSGISAEKSLTKSIISDSKVSKFFTSEVSSISKKVDNLLSNTLKHFKKSSRTFTNNFKDKSLSNSLKDFSKEFSYIHTNDKTSDKNFTNLTATLIRTIKTTDKSRDKTSDKKLISNFTTFIKDKLYKTSSDKSYNVSSFTTDKLIVSSLNKSVFNNSDSSNNSNSVHNLTKEFGQTFSNKLVSTFSNFIEKISNNKLLKYASGGFIQGPGSKTSDSVLIRASRGEYVIKAAAVEKYGVGLFDRLNAGAIPSNIFKNIFNSQNIKNVDISRTVNKIYNNLPRFAGGGLVGSSIITNPTASIRAANNMQVFIPKNVIHGKDLVTIFNRANQSISNNS